VVLDFSVALPVFSSLSVFRFWKTVQVSTQRALRKAKDTKRDSTGQTPTARAVAH
jgi:hypothetical protein